MATWPAGGAGDDDHARDDRQVGHDRHDQARTTEPDRPDDGPPDEEDASTRPRPARARHRMVRARPRRRSRRDRRCRRGAQAGRRRGRRRSARAAASGGRRRAARAAGGHEPGSRGIARGRARHQGDGQARQRDHDRRLGDELEAPAAGPDRDPVRRWPRRSRPAARATPRSSRLADQPGVVGRPVAVLSALVPRRRPPRSRARNRRTSKGKRNGMLRARQPSREATPRAISKVSTASSSDRWPRNMRAAAFARCPRIGSLASIVVSSASNAAAAGSAETLASPSGAAPGAAGIRARLGVRRVPSVDPGILGIEPGGTTVAGGQLRRDGQDGRLLGEQELGGHAGDVADQDVGASERLFLADVGFGAGRIERVTDGMPGGQSQAGARMGPEDDLDAPLR